MNAEITQNAELTPALQEGKALSPSSVEMNGDQVEFSMQDNKVYIRGNVVVKRGDGTTLTCDSLEYSRDTKMAVARGHVIITTPSGTMRGDTFTFNAETMRGKFDTASFASAPFYGSGESLAKVGDNQIQLNKGYLTTCDLDQPHFRMRAKKFDYFPGDKAVARNVKLMVGKVPLVYIPRYTQDLKNEPFIVFTPGHSKQWGSFLLSQIRYQMTPKVKLVLHADYRERKDFASGFDVKYDTTKFGNGLIRTYYMNQRDLGSKGRFYKERLVPTPERERFKGEWRHKWKIDRNTNAIWQYYKLSDKNFLKDYFQREYYQDTREGTFFLLTKNLPKGVLSLRADIRVNRFVGAVDRVPEVGYSVAGQEIGDTNFYLKSNNLYSNLNARSPSPTELRLKTQRLDSDNQLSRPFKVSFVEIKPYVGARQTYYSRSKELSRYDIIRGVFSTGSDLSTKFFKMFDVQSRILGVEINKLRHIITPSVAYLYRHDPTVPSTLLDQFDGVDSVERAHTLTFTLENKLQTKRSKRTVDLLRLILSSNFALKENPSKGGFSNVNSKLELKPLDWLSFSVDSSYNAHEDRLSSINFDLYINQKKWYLSLGKRLQVDRDDQLTSEFGYRINHKWKFKIYERFDTEHGILKEQNYAISRDLHEWELDLSFNEKRTEGDAILLIFRLKAFPEIGIEGGTSFNKRKAGSQTGTDTF